MDLRNLPVIDWELATKLVGNEKQFAEELLNLLIKNLSSDVARINQYYKDKNYTELLFCVHKLHGSLCYCGVPRLKTLVARLETDLKNNIMINLPIFLEQLDTEVNLLLEQHSCPDF